MATDQAITPEAPPKAQRTRSPNTPALSLEESIKKADSLYQANDKHYAQWEAAARQLGYSAKSSSFAKAIGALAQFGLIDDQGGGDKRQVKVSDRFLDIKLRSPQSPERKKALTDAALEPKLHKEIWDKYEGSLPPSDESIRVYLLRERADSTFNRASVDGFIDRLRKTLKFAGLTGDDKVDADAESDTPDNGTDPEAHQSDVRVGSFVQWTSQGVDQFKTPVRVAQIVDGPDGEKYAYVEGPYSGALAVSQLSVQEPPAPETPNLLGPNPFYKPQTKDEPQAGIALERAKLDEGVVLLEYPDGLSKESIEELQEWLVGRINRLRRNAKLEKIKISE